MLLNTYYRSLGAQFGANSDGLTFKDYCGTVQPYARISNSSYYTSLLQTLNFDLLGTIATNVNSNTNGVVFGDGTEPVTPDDWKLSGNILTGITCNANIQRTHCAEYAEAKTIYTITNGNPTDITVCEMGFYGRVPKGSAAFVGGLIERSVLDSPVTIPAGGVGQITYTIRMNYPTA